MNSAKATRNVHFSLISIENLKIPKVTLRNPRKDHFSKMIQNSSSSEKQLFGENFGARNPTVGEIESKFSEKVLGNYNTEHIIKPPEAIKNIVGLQHKNFNPLAEALDDKEINRLKNQIPGWKIIYSNNFPSLKFELRMLDNSSCNEMISRIKKMLGSQYSNISMFMIDNSISIELYSEDKKGLTINEFIAAAKINEIPNSDLMPKKKQRFWA